MAGIIRSTPLGGDITLATRGMVGATLITDLIRLTSEVDRHVQDHHTMAAASTIVQMSYIVQTPHVPVARHPSQEAVARVARHTRRLHRIAQMFVAAVVR